MQALILLTTAAVASARVFDSLSSIPEGWALSSPAVGGDQLALKIALKQQHAAALEQTVLSISDPGSPDYGKHLTREELRSYVAPSSQATDVSDIRSYSQAYRPQKAMLSRETQDRLSLVVTSQGRIPSVPPSSQSPRHEILILIQ